MLKRKSGFTLIELLVVISIISVLSIASLYTLNIAVPRARDQKRYKDLDLMEAALYSFYTQNGRFPDTGLAWQGVCNSFPDWIPGLVPEFISSLPQDPQGCRDNGGNFDGYIYRSNGTDFKVAADWMAEEGELCRTPADKYWDERRGPGQPSPAGTWFCSVSSPGGEDL